MLINEIEVFGFKAAFRGLRNPKNSWDKSDSKIIDGNFILGEKDRELALALNKAGTEHCKYLRFIQVWCDISLPLYVWKEFDTYKFIEKNSCSTMHKLTSKRLCLDDFQIDEPDTHDIATIKLLNRLIDDHEEAESKNKIKIFRKIIQKLPDSFLQKRTVTLNYAELRNMYRQRKHHKLEEWRQFCKWIESLPYSELIIN